MERLRELGSQNFDGDAAVMPEVLGQIDNRHSAATELALKSIAVANGLLDAALQIVHVPPLVVVCRAVEDEARADNPRE